MPRGQQPGFLTRLVRIFGKKSALVVGGSAAGLIGAGILTQKLGQTNETLNTTLSNFEEEVHKKAMGMEFGGGTLGSHLEKLKKQGTPIQLQYPSDLANPQDSDDLQQYFVKYTAMNTIGGTNKSIGPAAIISLPIVRAEMSEQISLQWQNETTALDELVGLARSTGGSLAEMFTGESGIKTIGAAVGGNVLGRMVGGKGGGAVGTLVGVGLAASVMQPGTMAAGTLRAMKSGLGGPELQGVAKTISRYAGLALHPYDAMYFSSPARRVFAPRYTLIAETQDDIDTIHRIVQTFKYCALPGLTGQGSAFTYPNKFQIEFHRPDTHGTIINDKGTYFPHFPHLMVCDSIDITYGDGDNLTLHQSMKAPIVMTISMMFREVDYFTKNNMTTPGDTYMTPGDALSAMFTKS